LTAQKKYRSFNIIAVNTIVYFIYLLKIISVRLFDRLAEKAPVVAREIRDGEWATQRKDNISGGVDD